MPLAEEGWTENDVAFGAAEIYLKELIEKDIDSVVLGCTHYPLLKKCIGEIVGEKVKIVDPANVTALKMKEFLEKNNMLNDSTKEGSHTFYVSDNTEKFASICRLVLKKEYEANKIDIEKY